MTKRLLLPFLLFLIGRLYGQQEETISVYFDTDVHTLRTDARQALDAFSINILQLPDYRLTVEAHTDDRGAEGYNEALATRRAQSVVQHLTATGVIVDKIETMGYGESRPAYANDSEEGRQGNRRVDLRLEPIAVPTLGDLLRRMTPGEQRYTIDPNQPTRLVGEQGSHCWIEPGSFRFTDGSRPDGPIEVVLREAYDVADMLLHGLSTASSGRPLQTGGMIYLAAEVDGQPLQLDADADILVGMPTESQQAGMQLFTGVAGPDGGVTDWQATGQDFRPSLEDFINMPPAPKMPLLTLVTRSYPVEYPEEPQEPGRPKAPFKPHKPERDQVKYDPGLVKSLLIGKKEIEAKEEEMFQKQMERYERSLARYQRDTAQHTIAMVRYRERLETYRIAHQEWVNQKHAIDARRDSLRYADEAEQRAAYQEKMDDFYDAYDAWQEERLRRIEAYYDQYLPAGQAGARLLRGYIYQVNRLGWINCDRFWNVPEEDKAVLAVNDQDEAEEMIYVHFKEEDSLLQATKQGDRYVTSNIPKDAAVRIIGVKILGGQPHLAIYETRVDAQASYTLTYEPVSVKEIRRQLRGLEG